MRSFAEKLYFFLVVTEVTGIAARLFGQPASGSVSPAHGTNPILAVLSIMAGVGTVFFCYPRMREIWSMLLHLRWLFLLYSWMALSLIWTETFVVTLLGSLHMIMYLFSAALLALRYDTEELLSLTTRFLVGAAFLSIPAQLILGEGIQDDGAGWSGMFPHKNTLGSCMMIAIVMLLVLRERLGWSRLMRMGSLILCVALLVLSESYTSVLSAVVSGAFVVSREIESGSKAILLMVLLCGFCFLLLVSDPFALILAAGGKDSSFTGRDAVWAFALLGIAQKPIFGHDYLAFWSDSDWSLEALHWSPTHAHDGLLQVSLDLGGVGLLLTLIVVLNIWRRTRRIHLPDPSLTRLWIMTLLIMACLHNVAETDLMVIHPIWYLLIFAAFSLIRFENEARQRRLFQEQETDLQAELINA